MVEEKSWQDFRESGLFWLVNTTLHAFGWALVAEFDGEELKRVYPARVKFRGFAEEINTEGYKRVSKYIKDNASELEEEANS